jgi:hypothetical protein
MLIVSLLGYFSLTFDHTFLSSMTKIKLEFDLTFASSTLLLL